jgi:hypothetical protein
MTESDADFFFGRARETAEVISALAAVPGKLPVPLGNSGVGKSSVAQAGVLAALKRQIWPENAGTPPEWPHTFRESQALVLPHAQAWDRTAQGAGRGISRHVAAWFDQLNGWSSKMAGLSSCAICWMPLRQGLTYMLCPRETRRSAPSRCSPREIFLEVFLGGAGPAPLKAKNKAGWYQAKPL